MTANPRASPRHSPVVESLAAAGHVAILCDEPHRRGDRDPREEILASPSLEIVERLIELARRPLPRAHVDRRLELAQLAVSTCERLSVKGSSPAVTLATARALGCLAAIDRSRGQIKLAETHLGRAHALLADAPDERTTAWLLSLDAAIFSDRGLWEDAIHVLEEVEVHARAVGDGHLAADAQIRRGVLQGWSESYETALETLTHAEQVSIDPAVHPRHALMARHYRIWFLHAHGEIDDTLELWQKSEDLYRQFEHDRWMSLHRAWLEARLTSACGLLEEGQALLSGLWSEFFAQGDPVSLSRASMDLCKVYVRRGKFALGWQLITRLVPFGQMWGMHRRTYEAYALLRHSFGAQTATVELVDRISRYLHRAWRNPDIPFQ